MPRLRDCSLFILVGLLCMLPAFIMGGGGSDLHLQSLWVKHFSRQFWQGDLYPRWLMGMFAGDGSPAFFYYPPVAYFITAFFAFLGPLDSFWFYTPLAASALLALTLSGVAFYIWMKEVTQNVPGAVLGSLMYMTALNHIYFNFYVLLLFSSVWSYVFIPLMMLFARGIPRKQPYSLVGFAVFLALQIMTNLPMTLLFGPLAVGYGLLHCTSKEWGRQVASLLGGVILGFGLSSSYLMPALVYMKSSNISTLWVWAVNGQDTGWDHLQTQKFFVGSIGDRDDYWNIAYLLYTVLSLMLYFRWVKDTSYRWFFFALGLSALFMMLPTSALLWQSFDLLRILQFPERFFALTTLCLSVMATLAWPHLRSFTIASVLLSIAVTLVFSWDTQVTQQDYKKTFPARYDTYLLDIDEAATYLPSHHLMERYTTKESLKAVKAANTLQLHVIKGRAEVRVKTWKPREIVFSYEASEPSQVRVRQFDFPGFRAFVGGQELPVAYDEPTGEMLVSLPPGKGNVELRLTKLLPEKAGNALSALCALIVILLVLLELRRKAVPSAR